MHVKIPEDACATEVLVKPPPKFRQCLVPLSLFAYTVLAIPPGTTHLEADELVGSPMQQTVWKHNNCTT